MRVHRSCPYVDFVEDVLVGDGINPVYGYDANLRIVDVFAALLFRVSQWTCAVDYSMNARATQHEHYGDLARLAQWWTYDSVWNMKQNVSVSLDMKLQPDLELSVVPGWPVSGNIGAGEWNFNRFSMSLPYQIASGEHGTYSADVTTVADGRFVSLDYPSGQNITSFQELTTQSDSTVQASLYEIEKMLFNLLARQFKLVGGGGFASVAPRTHYPAFPNHEYLTFEGFVPVVEETPFGVLADTVPNGYPIGYLNVIIPDWIYGSPTGSVLSWRLYDHSAVVDSDFTSDRVVYSVRTNRQFNITFTPFESLPYGYNPSHPRNYTTQNRIWTDSGAMLLRPFDQFARAVSTGSETIFTFRAPHEFTNGQIVRVQGCEENGVIGIPDDFYVAVVLDARRVQINEPTTGTYSGRGVIFNRAN